MGKTSQQPHIKRVQQLKKFYRQHNRLPSYTEMMKLFAVRSKNAVYRIMQKLQDQGYVRKESGKFVPGEKLMPLKVLGAVEAGFPSPAEEELADAISLDRYLIENHSSTFLLRVSGESMIDAGIHPDDLVLVERHKQAKSGDIVIANVDQEYTIKRLGKHNKKPALLPANTKFKPIQFDTGSDSEIKIEGVVIAVVRKY